MTFNTLAINADTEWLMIDSSIVCIHKHAAGAKRGRKAKCWGVVEEVLAQKFMQYATVMATCYVLFSRVVNARITRRS